MFNSISWEQYGMAVIVVLSAYYFFVLVIYYRRDLEKISLRDIFRVPILLKQKTGKGMSIGNRESVLSSSVHELMADLNVLFLQAEKQQFSKDRLSIALQTILRN
jgi:hypothetical protein